MSYNPDLTAGYNVLVSYPYGPSMNHDGDRFCFWKCHSKLLSFSRYYSGDWNTSLEHVPRTDSPPFKTVTRTFSLQEDAELLKTYLERWDPLNELNDEPIAPLCSLPEPVTVQEVAEHLGRTPKGVPYKNPFSGRFAAWRKTNRRTP